MIGSANGLAVSITGLGSHVPEQVVTNDDLSVIMDTSDEWIRERTGIRERRIGGTTSQLAIDAGNNSRVIALLGQYGILSIDGVTLRNGFYTDPSDPNGAAPTLELARTQVP